MAYKICKFCGIEIIEQLQSVQHRKNGDYIRNECKTCRVKNSVAWKKKKYEEKVIPCEVCGELCIRKSHRSLCSLKCRLEGNIKKEEDCWIWQGKINQHGYGEIMIDRKRRTVHRVSYEFYKQKINKDLLIRHICNNRRCINPDHLLHGDLLANMRDMVKSGRSCRGERHHNSKFNNNEINMIRKMHKNGESQTEIAKKFNVSQPCIGYIVRHDSWKHIK